VFEVGSQKKNTKCLMKCTTPSQYCFNSYSHIDARLSKLKQQLTYACEDDQKALLLEELARIAVGIQPSKVEMEGSKNGCSDVQVNSCDILVTKANNE